MCADGNAPLTRTAVDAMHAMHQDGAGCSSSELTKRGRTAEETRKDTEAEDRQKKIQDILDHTTPDNCEASAIKV